MAQNGIYYSSGNTISFTTNNTTWVVLSSGGTLSVPTISATTYQNLPVSAVTSGTGISASTSNGVATVTNTDLGSSQNIFKNIQVAGVTQFSAGSNNANLNFSGINITVTSASTNTLVFSASSGNSGTVTGSGTTNNIPKWTGSTVLGDSQITDDGSYVTIPSLIISTSGIWSPIPTDTNVGLNETLYPLYVSSDTNISQSLNEGFVSSDSAYLNNTFITILNDQDHRSIKIFYNIISDDDVYYRSGDIIANWDSGYTTFNQTEYGPVGNLPVGPTINSPTIQHGGIHSEIGIYISGTYPQKVKLKIKYVLL